MRSAWSLELELESELRLRAQRAVCSQLARMIANERLRLEGETARERAKVEKKIQRKLQLLYGALKPYLVPNLVPKVGTHNREIVFCETSYYFMLKVVGGSGRCVPVTLLVRRAALLDGLFQTVVEIFLFAALGNFGLIVEFDLVDQQARKALGLAMHFLILGRDSGTCRNLWGRARSASTVAAMTDRQRLRQRGLYFSQRRLRTVGSGGHHWNVDRGSCNGY